MLRGTSGGRRGCPRGARAFNAQKPTGSLSLDALSAPGDSTAEGVTVAMWIKLGTTDEQLAHTFSPIRGNRPKPKHTPRLRVPWDLRQRQRRHTKAIAEMDGTEVGWSHHRMSTRPRSNLTGRRRWRRLRRRYARSRRRRGSRRRTRRSRRAVATTGHRSRRRSPSSGSPWEGVVFLDASAALRI